jgi:hydroxyacylglutathione hydrolase
MGEITDYEFGISAIDAGYVRPRLAAIHLIVENGRAALIDSGSNAAVPRVLAALAAKGLGADSVDYLILTHIHLDHAGGAGALMAQLPRARLAVHPRGARHMADPSRLLAGVSAVYGADATCRLYGAVVPVPPERIVETPDLSVLDLNGRELLILDTPGHARHHVCIVDRRSGHVFSGDTFGLSYRELDREGRQFIFPTTTPVQFDPAALHRSVDRLLSYEPAAIYVTHYGQVREPRRLGADLHRLIDAHVALARAQADVGKGRHEHMVEGLTQILLAESQRQGWTLPRGQLVDIFATDIALNAQGLECWLDGAA